jgi:putative acetyltransferase
MREGEVEVRCADGPEDMAVVRKLFREYARWLDFDLCFQGFEEELTTLPGRYAPPRGGLWLAEVGDAPVGVVGLRPLEAHVCELKRLWVRAPFRGLGLGRRLTETAIAAARLYGYRAMRLDTVGPRMTAAQALYGRLGFIEIPPYYHNPQPEVSYLQLDLRARSTGVV